MFHSNDLKTPTQNLRRRIYCALFMMLLVAGDVFAEDDLADLDPDYGFTISGVFRQVLDFLNGLIA